MKDIYLPFLDRGDLECVVMYLEFFDFESMPLEKRPNKKEIEVFLYIA
jgi:hypothetical protein